MCVIVYYVIFILWLYYVVFTLCYIMLHNVLCYIIFYGTILYCTILLLCYVICIAYFTSKVNNNSVSTTAKMPFTGQVSWHATIVLE